VLPAHRCSVGDDGHSAAPRRRNAETPGGKPPAALAVGLAGRGVVDRLSDEQAQALDHARNALAVHATQLRGIERDYRARLLDEPAQLVASAAEQAERSAEVIAHMLNPRGPRPHGDGAEARSLSGSAGNPI
jgi:hypothetical protein